MHLRAGKPAGLQGAASAVARRGEGGRGRPAAAGTDGRGHSGAAEPDGRVQLLPQRHRAVPLALPLLPLRPALPPGPPAAAGGSIPIPDANLSLTGQRLHLSNACTALSTRTAFHLCHWYLAILSLSTAIVNLRKICAMLRPCVAYLDSLPSRNLTRDPCKRWLSACGLPSAGSHISSRTNDSLL